MGFAIFLQFYGRLLPSLNSELENAESNVKEYISGSKEQNMFQNLPTKTVKVGIAFLLPFYGSSGRSIITSSSSVLENAERNVGDKTCDKTRRTINCDKRHSLWSSQWNTTNKKP